VNTTFCLAGLAPAVLSKWREEIRMLETIAVILLLMWLLGMVTAYTIGGFIHILLVIAIIVILVRVIQGRRPI
jgi:hypothetical protein